MQTVQPTSTEVSIPAKTMPGGGAGKEAKKEKAPVDPKYTTPCPEEKGEIDESRVAKLKANSKRPAPLKRTSRVQLEKEAKKKLKESRKQAAAKYKARSETTKKDLTYRKNYLSRDSKRKQQLASVNEPAPRKMGNCEIIYSVGPQPKYKAISQRFRDFREYSTSKIKFSPTKKQQVTYLYKVGQSVVA